MTSSILSFSVSSVTGSPAPFINRPILFSLVFPLLPIHLKKPVLLLFTSLARFNTRLSSAFPTPSLNFQRVALYLSQVICPCFHLLHTSFLCFKFCQELLAYLRRPPATFACLPAHQDGPFFSLLKKTPHTHPPFLQSISHRILPGRSLVRSESAPLKPRVVILLFALFPPHRILNSITSRSLQPRLPLTFRTPSSSLLFVSVVG